MAFIFAIVIGLVVGILIKKVRIGIMIRTCTWIYDCIDRLATNHTKIIICKHRITIRRHSLKTGITGMCWSSVFLVLLIVLFYFLY